MPEGPKSVNRCGVEIIQRHAGTGQCRKTWLSFRKDDLEPLRRHRRERFSASHEIPAFVMKGGADRSGRNTEDQDTLPVVINLDGFDSKVNRLKELVLRFP